MNFGVQNVGEFVGIVAVGRSQDQGFHGGQQSPYRENQTAWWDHNP